MNKSLAKSWLEGNWFLIAIIAGLLIGAVWGATRDEEALNQARAHAAGDMTGDVSGLGPKMTGSRWAAPTKSQKIQADIDHYKVELATNRNSPETAANLYRLGNLYYSKSQDYDKASLHYEDLLQNHPDFAGAATVFPNLVACYERLGNLALERYTYKRMLDYFSSDSQEHLFASKRLGVE